MSRQINRHRLGAVQLQIMQALWARQEATIAEIQLGLGRRTALAYVTVATMLRRLEARGLVKHRQEGRQFIYRAMVAERAVTRTMTTELLDRLFAGSIPALLSNLLSQREVNPAELLELEKLIAERKRSHES